MKRQIENLRRFNRRWTETMGLLDEQFLGTKHSLPEARVLFELGQKPTWERMELKYDIGVRLDFPTLSSTVTQLNFLKPNK